MKRENIIHNLQTNNYIINNKKSVYIRVDAYCLNCKTDCCGEYKIRNVKTNRDINNHKDQLGGLILEDVCKICDKSTSCIDCLNLINQGRVKCEIELPRVFETGYPITFPGLGEQRRNLNEISGDFIVKLVV